MKIIGFRQEPRRNPALELLPTDIKYPTTEVTYFDAVHEALRPRHSVFPRMPRRTMSFWAHRAEYHDKIYAPSLLSFYFDANAAEPNFDVAAWDRAEQVRGMQHGRRPFVTGLGFIGLAPIASMIGDEICILFGGRVPYVIRREGKLCRFVGECYAYGIMHGEPMEDYDEKRTEIFTIY